MACLFVCLSVPLFVYRCAKMIEDHRTAMKGKGSAAAKSELLVDSARIHAAYGVGVAVGVATDGGPAVGRYPDSPAHSEDTPIM